MLSAKQLPNYSTFPFESFAEHVNLREIVRKGVSNGFLSQNVEKSFECFDHTVPFPLKIRYLLLQAYEKKEYEPIKYTRWVDLLGMHGIPSYLVKIVTLECKHEVYDSSDSTQLLPRHLSVLTNKLTNHAGMWSKIIIHLNLPLNIKKEIEFANNIIKFNNVWCLYLLLMEWVSGEHKDSRTPTLKNLIAALRSDTVSLGNIANELQTNLDKEGMSFLSLISKTSDDLPHGPLEIVAQSRDTTVAEEKSTLLEVHAIAASQATISYQWNKDGCPLKDDHLYYSGVHTPTLCMNSATLASNGKYACELKVIANCTTVIQSEPVLVTVEVTSITKAVVDMYTQKPVVQEDTWPPKNSSTYINLDLIRQEKIDYKDKDDYASYTLQGDVDDVMYKKESIEYEQAFSEYISGAFLLIEGRPGSGKTTLVHKISRDWGEGKPILKGAELLFLFPLRIVSKKSQVRLIDILKLFYHNDQVAESMLQRIETSNGEGICFIMDGLDEYGSKEGNESIVFKMINKKYLQRSMVIVASRPVASTKLKDDAGKHIEVLGFLKEQIFEYVDSYPFTSASTTSDKLKYYLIQHPNIMHMCYLPVHAAMVCFMHENISDGELPHTETGIYECFALFTLLRIRIK